MTDAHLAEQLDAGLVRYEHDPNGSSNHVRVVTVDPQTLKPRNAPSVAKTALSYSIITGFSEVFLIDGKGLRFKATPATIANKRDTEWFACGVLNYRLIVVDRPTPHPVWSMMAHVPCIRMPIGFRYLFTGELPPFAASDTEIPDLGRVRAGGNRWNSQLIPLPVPGDDSISWVREPKGYVANLPIDLACAVATAAAKCTPE